MGVLEASPIPTPSPGSIVTASAQDRAVFVVPGPRAPPDIDLFIVEPTLPLCAVTGPAARGVSNVLEGHFGAVLAVDPEATGDFRTRKLHRSRRGDARAGAMTRGECSTSKRSLDALVGQRMLHPGATTRRGNVGQRMLHPGATTRRGNEVARHVPSALGPACGQSEAVTPAVHGQERDSSNRDDVRRVERKVVRRAWRVGPLRLARRATRPASEWAR
jgi:hypothetical protein